MENMDKITGMILAGGVSRRLNYKNKALLKIGNASIIEHIIGALSKVTESIVLITNSSEEFAHLGLPTFSDIIPESGSLGGIYTGLKVSKTHYNLVVACDMPFVQPHLLKFLIDNSSGYDVTIPITPDGLHPTCAVYSKDCIEFIETQIGTRDLKIISFFPYVKVNRVDVSILFPCYDPNVFLNINTNEDYLKALSIAET